MGKQRKKELTPRLAKYVDETLKNIKRPPGKRKNKKEIAIIAGYSKNTARKPKECIEKRCAMVLGDALKESDINKKRIAEKIDEGLDCTKLQSIAFKVIKVADYPTQHKFLQSAIDLLGLGKQDAPTVNIDSALIKIQQYLGEYTPK